MAAGVEPLVGEVPELVAAGLELDLFDSVLVDSVLVDSVLVDSDLVDSDLFDSDLSEFVFSEAEDAPESLVAALLAVSLLSFR